MKTIKIKNKKYPTSDLKAIVGYLEKGKVMVYPTDTIYGIGCLATDKKAIKRIFKIKEKESKKPLLILVSSLAMAKKYCRINRQHEAYLKKIWPARVTVILESRGILPKELTGGVKSNGQAVRLPKNDFLIKMIKKAGVPLVSTSANLSGEKVIASPFGLDEIFVKNKPDLVVDGGELEGKASKLVDLRDINNIKILRK